ncbi:MAG TPA: glycosyltransferase family 39 protein [Anaerolineae bacterium]|nr:glycosyltransferase family 39 protein [Anaerolineae bacterium]
MKRPRWLLLGILLGAFLLRMVQLDARAMWYDEAFAVLYAETSFAQMWYGTVTQVQGAASDVHPLFFYTMLHGWMNAVGASALAARFFSVLFGVATVAVVYRLTRELCRDDGEATLRISRRIDIMRDDVSRQTTADRRKFSSSERLPLLAAFIVAVAPFAVAYSQEARMYAQLGFFAALFLLAYVMLEKPRRRAWWIVLVLSGAAMLYSHNLAVFFGAALGVWIVIQVLIQRNWRGLISFAFAGAAILLGWLPWLTLVPSQLSKIEQAYWISTPTLLTVLQTVLTFTADFDNARFPLPLLPFALIAALLLFVLFCYEFLRGGWRDKRVCLLAHLAILPPALIFVASLWRPVYITRALMPSFLMAAILVAWLGLRLPPLLGKSLGVALALLAAASLVFYYTYADFPRPPFREALAYLQAQSLPGDVIVHDNKLSFFPMYYYARGDRLTQSFIADPPGAGSDTLARPTQEALGLYAVSPQNATQAQTRVWFIMFREAHESGAGNLDWMRAQYREIQESSFHDLELYLFEK